jgi:hypothetical protein
MLVGTLSAAILHTALSDTEQLAAKTCSPTQPESANYKSARISSIAPSSQSRECWKETSCTDELLSSPAPALTIMTSAVLAQQPRIPTNRDSQNGAQAPQPQRAISQDEVRHDLQQAGFNNIEFLQSAYVVRPPTGTEPSTLNRMERCASRTARIFPVSPEARAAQP